MVSDLTVVVSEWSVDGEYSVSDQKGGGLHSLSAHAPIVIITIIFIIRRLMQTIPQLNVTCAM